MKKLDRKQFLIGMSYINEKYIDAFNTEILRRKRKHILHRILTAAGTVACICLTITGFVYGIYLYQQHTTITPTPVITDKFVIEDGRLISYNGTDTKIVIPDSVTEITETAFNESSVVNSISSIELNNSVNRIDEYAFCNLTSLQSITVPDDNPYFISQDGIIGSVDGSAYFSVTLSPEETSYKLHGTIKEMQKNTEYFGRIATISIGRGILKIYFKGDNESSSKAYVTSLSAFGYEKEFDTPLLLEGDWGTNIKQTNISFITSLYSNTGKESTWIFTENGVYEIINADNESDTAHYHTKFLLRFGEKEKIFVGEKLNWRNSSFFFEDMTGDGIPEIAIIFIHATGTGIHLQNAHIFDSITLEEYEIEDMPNTLPDNVSFASDDETYTIVTSNGTHKIMKANLKTENKENLAENVVIDQSYKYTVTDGKLHFITSCKVGIVEYHGEIDVALKYNGKKFVYDSSSYTPPDDE